MPTEAWLTTFVKKNWNLDHQGPYRDHFQIGLRRCEEPACLVAQSIKNSPCNSGDFLQCKKSGDLDLNPGSGRSPTEGNGTPLQYSCLENPMGRGQRSLVGYSWVEKVEYDLVTKPPLPPRRSELYFSCEKNQIN